MTQGNDSSGLTPAAEVIFDVVLAAKRLGLQTSPTEAEPHKIITEIDIKEMPQRMFELARAVEALDRADAGEIEQILDGAETILGLKLAIHAILGWIAARGLPTREVAQMVMQAVQGPSRPSGSIIKLAEKRAQMTEAMGAASPKSPAPGY